MFLNFTSSQVSFDSLRENATGKKVILLYPWANQRMMFLSRFLEGAQEGLLYFDINRDVGSIGELAQLIVDEMRFALHGFGKQLKAVIASGDVEKIGKALALDLNEIAQEPVILFIDGLDRIHALPDLDVLLRTVVQHLNDNVQIAFSSRVLTYPPLVGLLSSGHAVVLGTERHRSEVKFTVQHSPKPQLEVRAFGPGEALLNGDPIINWDGMLPRNLFFYFIDHPLVTRDEIFADFWSNVPNKDATDIFHVTKHKVSEILNRKMGTVGEYELTQYKQGFYIPSDKLVRHYDVDDFTTNVEKARLAEHDHEAELLLRHALTISGAPFLSAMEAQWVQRRRHVLSLQRADAILQLGGICERKGETQEAIALYEQGLELRPEREDAHRGLMRLYAQAGRIADARAHYARFTENIHSRYGIRPSPETAALAEQLKLTE
jgi:two-component SAPR family response regulator